MLPPVQTNTKMSAFNVDMSSLHLPTRSSRKSTGRKEDRRKAQRLLPISTSTPPLLPPNNSHKQRVQSIQCQKWAGGLNRSGRGVANERVISTYCRFVSSKHSTTPIAALSHNHHAHQEVTYAARQAGKPRRGGCGGDTASRCGNEGQGKRGCRRAGQRIGRKGPREQTYSRRYTQTSSFDGKTSADKTHKTSRVARR
jgi:hypothetical protein